MINPIKKNFILIILLFISYLSKGQDTLKIHRQAIVVDTHNDALSNQLITKADLGKLQTYGNFDLVRAKQGGLDVQVFSVFCDGTYKNGTAFKYANREIDSLYALIRRHPDKIQLVTTALGLKKVVKENKMAALIGVEGGHMIEGRLDYIDSLAKRGMIYLTLTWNNSTPWASSAMDERYHQDSLKHLGLNDFGKQVVKRLNELNVIVDVSHVGEHTFWDAIATSTKPIIASHSSVYALCPHQRNLKDDQIKAVAKTGGVVFVNFFSGFLDSTFEAKYLAYRKMHRHELDSLMSIYHDNVIATVRLNDLHKDEYDAMRPPLSLLIKHIDYMVKLVGADHVGLGADFEGAESYPMGMDSVADYPKITAELLKLNYSIADIDKILGGNFIRVLKANRGE